jgi:hypothetical protein
MPNNNYEASAAVNKIQRKRARDARAVYATAPGKSLIWHICREANIFNSNLPPLDTPIDPYRLAELEGRRNIALGLLELTFGNLDEPAVMEQVTESMLEDEETYD